MEGKRREEEREKRRRGGGGRGRRRRKMGDALKVRCVFSKKWPKGGPHTNKYGVARQSVGMINGEGVGG